MQKATATSQKESETTSEKTIRSITFEKKTAQLLASLNKDYNVYADRNVTIPKDSKIEMMPADMLKDRKGDDIQEFGGKSRPEFIVTKNGT